MKKIRTAIIGLGNIAHGYDDNPNVVKRITYPTHLSALVKNPHFELVAGSDPSRNARQIFGKKLGRSDAIYADHIAMLKTVRPDMVVIASPTKFHYQHCSEAIQLNIPTILVEKPIAYSISDAQKILRAAHKKKISIACNYFRSFDAGYRKMSEHIREQHWGTLEAIRALYSHGLFNNASHIVNLVEMLFGNISHIRSLDAPRAKTVEQDPTISFIGSVKYAPVIFNGLNNAQYRIFEIDMLFTNGRLTLISDSLTEYRPKSSHGFSFLHKQVKPVTNIDIGTSMLDVYANLYSHITSRKKLFCSGNDALQTLRVCSAVLTSARQNNRLIKTV